MVGKAGLAADQTLGGVTIGSGGAITLVAGDVAGTTLRLGAFSAGAAGGTLLITAPTNTKVFLSNAYRNTILNNRLVFSDGTANTFNWVQNNNSAANVVTAYVPVTALPVIGGGGASTSYILTGSQTQTTANFVGQSLKLSSTSGSAQTLDLSTFNMQLGQNANSPGAILIDGTAAWNINGSTGVLMATVGGTASDLIFQQYNTTNAVTVNAGIANNGATALVLTKAGPGTLVLAGTNTFTGIVHVGGGILKFSNVTAAGAGSLGNGSTTAVNISNGATLQYTGTSGAISGAAATPGAHTYSLVGGNGAISVSESATELTLNGAISGAGSLVKSGDGTLTLGAAATYTGSTIINTGTLKNSAADRLPTTPVFINTGAVWNMSAGDDTVGTIFGGGTIEAGGTARTLTVGGDNVSSMTTDGSNSFTTFTGIFSGAAAHNLTKVGTGTVTLANTVTSAWTGTTTISAGTLMIGAGTNAGDIATSSSIINNSALVYNVGAGTRSYGNAISGTGSLTQQSIGGTLTLSGTNTYTGATTVSGGSLQVGSSGTGKTGTGAVTVQTSSTILGTGVIQGTTFTADSGSTIRPGDSVADSSHGTLTFTPVSASATTHSLQGSIILGISGATTTDATFGGNAIGSAGYNALVDAVIGVGSHDRLVFNNPTGGTGYTLDFLTTTGKLEIVGSSFTPQMGQIFNLLDWSNLVATNFTGFTYNSGYLTGNNDEGADLDLPDISSSGLLWDFSRFTTSGNIAVVSIVPEPSRALLLMLGLVGLMTRRRRSRSLSSLSL
jgi:autotransporter-associated beta strand protein